MTGRSVQVKAERGRWPARWWQDPLVAPIVHALIRNALADGLNANEAARHVGISSKTIHRIRARTLRANERGE